MSRIIRRCLSSGPVTAAYLRKVETGAVRKDVTQVALAGKLDSLRSELASLPATKNDTAQQLSATYLSSTQGDALTRSIASAKRKLKSLFSKPTPQGMYIYGSVGVGKSFLMDLFFDTIDDTTRKQRVHFNEFMLHVHDRIFQLKKLHPRQDVVPLVAMELLADAQVLCFDEFQVTDIADAMILKRVFDILFDVGGIVVVATSNRPPDDLYKGGINRSLFLPFIDTLKERCDVIAMDSLHDYRRDIVESGASYFVGSKYDSHQQSLEAIFGINSSGDDELNTAREEEIIPVMFGRTVKVARANEKCAWFGFKELCHKPLGAADYISICNHFPTLIVDQVPQLGANFYNEARRFVTLIDACYELRTRLVIAAEVPLNELFVDFDAAVESTDGDEELEETPQHNLSSESFLSGEGGSSSSFSTTMIRTKDGGDMEWSATGRVGVSLAQLSAVNDVSFSFKRAASRLAEMSGTQWGRK
jgi:protein AFG1